MIKQPLLTVENLSVGYGTRVVCSGIHFTSNAGEICCIIGPNGCGKTTLLSTLYRQLAPLSGSILLHGADLTHISAKDFAKQAAIVTTHRPRTGRTTCREIVEIGRYPYVGLFGKLSERDHAAVSSAMQDADVADLAEQYFTEISDGQKQRVLLAKAFAQDTKLLLLDEPTSFLDIRYRLEFLEVLSQKIKRTGLSVVMSVHEIAIARQTADTVVCLGDGRMQACGKPDLLTDERIRALFQLRMDAPLMIL